MRAFFSLKKTTARILLAFYIFSALFFSFSAGSLCSFGAVAWPTLTQSVNAGAAVCIDADTGAVLYGKNMNEQKFPASITKVMTAIIVLENCDLDEEVVFSETALNNLEPGAVTARTSVGDVLTVRDCLYALLYRSANEVANALAEHVAGSIPAFVDLMNEKAKELGCINTHFENPSGLNDENHYTTAYDMALIGREAMDNPTFLDIEDDESYRIGATAEVPQGMVVTIGHKMLRSTGDYTDSRVVGGKTGYTSLAGNTLITMAEDNGRRLVAVVLEDRNPYHYTDTEAMLDLGFDSFTNVDASGLMDTAGLEERLVTDGIIPEGANNLKSDRALYLTLPYGADASEVTADYEYNLSGNAPRDAVAKVDFLYGDHTAGSYFILNERESTLSILEDVPTGTKVAVLSVSLATIAGIAAFVLLGGGTAYHAHNVSVEKKQLKKLKEKRRRRLESMGVSEEEFRRLVENRKKAQEQNRSQRKAENLSIRNRYKGRPRNKG